MNKLISVSFLLFKKLTRFNFQAETGEETTSSQGEWEEYNDTLNDVLTWLAQAEKNLNAQSMISNDVDEVKDQFHEHEVGRYLTIIP